MRGVQIDDETNLRNLKKSVTSLKKSADEYRKHLADPRHQVWSTWSLNKFQSQLCSFSQVDPTLIPKVRVRLILTSGRRIPR